MDHSPHMYLWQPIISKGRFFFNDKEFKIEEWTIVDVIFALS